MFDSPYGKLTDTDIMLLSPLQTAMCVACIGYLVSALPLDDLEDSEAASLWRRCPIWDLAVEVSGNKQQHALKSRYWTRLGRVHVPRTGNKRVTSSEA